MDSTHAEITVQWGLHINFNKWGNVEETQEESTKVGIEELPF